jgi:hypothetical protein
LRLERVLPYLIGTLMLLVDGALAALGWGPWNPSGTAPLYFWMALAGGPPCLLLTLALAPKLPRQAGALLWLGSATLAMGIGLGSGSHVGRYFLWLVLFVLPQVLAASLFLARGRKAAKPQPGTKPGR